MHKKILRCTFHLHLFMRSVDSKYGDIIAVPTIKNSCILGEKIDGQKGVARIIERKEEK